MCDSLRIKLVDSSDPDKCFGPRTDYDTTSMTWYIRQDKMSSILTIITEVLEEGEATARVLKRLCGKLIDIRNLIPGAKYHLAHLLMASGSVTEAREMEKVVTVDN